MFLLNVMSETHGSALRLLLFIAGRCFMVLKYHSQSARAGRQSSSQLLAILNRWNSSGTGIWWTRTHIRL